jgi:hypothetical protein
MIQSVDVAPGHQITSKNDWFFKIEIFPAWTEAVEEAGKAAESSVGLVFLIILGVELSKA